MLSTMKKSKIQKKKKEKKRTREKVRKQDLDHAKDQEKKQPFFFYKFPPRRCILVQFSRFWFRRKADIKLGQIIITLLCFQIFEYRPRQCVRNTREITIDFLNILQKSHIDDFLGEGEFHYRKEPRI